ncbi:hypothetical protein [Burkholderia stabilis]|uniref:hypothetical protein n=1 Tax=Burkholderia stabilis TaxID=95485 RepID=UPI00158C51C1|nr:hypothetical protein [Burkholderia stabilis]
MTIMLVETVDINAHIAENPAFRPPPWLVKKSRSFDHASHPHCVFDERLQMNREFRS